MIALLFFIFGPMVRPFKPKLLVTYSPKFENVGDMPEPEL
jgi:hypothetical protein